MERFFEGRGVLSVNTSSVPSLFLSFFISALFFFSRSHPTEKATINESMKGAFTVLHSLHPSFRSSIFSKVDEKRREKQIVGKIVSLFANMPCQPESPKSGPREDESRFFAF